jgi:hypothetical protein
MPTGLTSTDVRHDATSDDAALPLMLSAADDTSPTAADAAARRRCGLMLRAMLPRREECGAPAALLERRPTDDATEPCRRAAPTAPPVGVAAATDDRCPTDDASDTVTDGARDAREGCAIGVARYEDEAAAAAGGDDSEARCRMRPGDAGGECRGTVLIISLNSASLPLRGSVSKSPTREK